ncbi:tRNA (5-methylaminomethyl-2-thiouridine)(34)-methyltransferase MnmD [uncultured Croceitalea sp.]|uniref:tRNA (5-methylaminomethyl-2-thiouridine)(34)-methyltransferase MnmD n=1 Tax=uncultured Croceitalea sp. TaxID=1798908 RepID=UPI003305CC16
MKRKIVATADGSKTIHLEDWNEQYHSKHGAVQEAYHVFIESGLRLFNNRALSILEIGFGTGLNALITLREAEKLKLVIDYVGVEAFPVTIEEANAMGYPQQLNWPELEVVFESMHSCKWNEKVQLTRQFQLTKQQKDFRAIDVKASFDLIYFDAFGARVQPELWDAVMFKKMFKAIKPQGVLVTYSAKGSVRRAMQEVGFFVERLPGPPGKREMLRATKR